MNIIAFVVLVIAALACFLAWYVASPRRFASSTLGLCLFVVGVILVFVCGSVEPIVRIGG